MDYLLPVFLSFAVAGIVAWYYIPRIIRIVKELSLSDKPAKHKIHTSETPTLGGIGIFGGFAFGFLLTVDGHIDNVAVIILAVIGFLFTGLKDDLAKVNPWTKFLEIITLSLVVVFFTGLRFTSLHGFLGITQLPMPVSVVLSVFLMVLIINSVNLIDGIDGLAASVGIIASVAFGSFFWMSSDYGYTVMAAALTGALVAFLPFNFTTGDKKTFMGDTGSLAIGFLVTIFAIRFNELDAAGKTYYDFLSAPTVSIAVLIIPLFDTLRIIVLRLYHKKSLFEADNRHIHHLMLQAGFSHGMTTLILSVFNLAIMAVAVSFDHFGILWLGLLLLIICIAGNEIVRYRIRSRARKQTAI